MVRVTVDTTFFRRSGKLTSTGPHLEVTRRTALRTTALFVGAIAVWLAVSIHAQYTISLQTPIRIHFQSPIVVSRRVSNPNAAQARVDQHRNLNAYQQYTCKKFGPDCRIALAIQRAENPQGKCEVYHYNADGTLDWGYFQINTVHLKRRGLNLRDLLDCKANIDFAFELYREKHGFSAWSTFNNGAYRKELSE
jgi:hypothetical protein